MEKDSRVKNSSKLTCNLCRKKVGKSQRGLSNHIARYCTESEKAKVWKPTNQLGDYDEYKPEYEGKVFEYLKECHDEMQEEIVAYTQREFDGPMTNVSKRKRLKIRLPSIVGFAVFLEVDESTLHEWKKKYNGFAKALRMISTYQHLRLIEGGLNNDYNTVITKLMMSTNHGYVERKENTHKEEGLTLEKLLAEIEREKAEEAAQAEED